MKLFLLSFLFPALLSANVLRPEPGSYQCGSGNEESICDQELQVFYNAGKLSAVKVEYVGWCGSMGPYTYYCQDTVCQDAGILIQFKDAQNYRWINKSYGFVCDFMKK